MKKSKRKSKTGVAKTARPKHGVSMTKHKLNWAPSRPDHRDYLFKDAVLPLPTLPAKVDNSAGMGPVQDQGQIGSCTGESSNAASEYIERQYGIDMEFEGSTLFCYYDARTSADKSRDSGAQVRDAIKGLATYGNASVKLWPYNAKRLAVKPPATAYKDAATRKISVYLKATSLQEIKTGLALHHPVVIGFTCYQGLESSAAAKTGIVPMPVGKESPIGGHAICLVGYDDSTRLLKFKNSWGPSWGDHGYGYLPYAYVTTGLASDFWVLTK